VNFVSTTFIGFESINKDRVHHHNAEAGVTPLFKKKTNYELYISYFLLEKLYVDF
jgi:hypothetical protein